MINNSDPDLVLSKELDKDLLDHWKVPDPKEPKEVEFDTKSSGIYHEPIDLEAQISSIGTRLPQTNTVPGISYEVLS